MELSPILTEPKPKRSLSQGVQAWRDSSIHPLFSTQGLVRVRTHLSIADWILTGSCLQSLILLVKPAGIPLRWALAPTFALVAFKITRLALTCFGWLENVHMRDMIPGRQMAVFPGPLNEEGRMVREVGRTVGGEKVVVVLITSKCNHPLGMFHPTAREMGAYGRAMYTALEKNAEEFGLLGYSDYNSNSSETHPVNLSLMYFKSMEHLMKFAHEEVHRAGWDWWLKMSKEEMVDEVSIGHEIYEVDAGKWENIKLNAPPSDFAATSHAIKTAGGERRWMCPIMDANQGFKTSASRMSTVKA